MNKLKVLIILMIMIIPINVLAKTNLNGTFSFKEFGKKDTVIKTINVNKGIQKTVDAVLENTSGALIEKGKQGNVEQNINLEENVSAPIEKGQKLGEISFSINGETLASVNIVAKESVDKVTFRKYN